MNHEQVRGFVSNYKAEEPDNLMGRSSGPWWWSLCKSLRKVIKPQFGVPAPCCLPGVFSFVGMGRRTKKLVDKKMGDRFVGWELGRFIGCSGFGVLASVFWLLAPGSWLLAQRALAVKHRKGAGGLLAAGITDKAKGLYSRTFAVSSLPLGDLFRFGAGHF